jgi:2-polyprenyl-3-methyl-5-hydroxy-6-metoxy-1,4-benzoquinol methylase
MQDLKTFYKSYNDQIFDKRFNSTYAVRKYAHYCQYQSILEKVNPGMKVLDAGCGDGVLSVMMAKKGAIVTGTDISEPNIDAAKKYALEQAVSVDFRVADIENIPFPDSEFDMVVSSHVLEHIPDFDRGLLEIMRVTKVTAVVAIPTIFNSCSLVQVGGGQYYLKGLRSFAALPIGFVLMVGAKLLCKEGVDEGYAGNGVVHIFRFPGVMRKKIKKYGFRLVAQEASTLCLPYFESLLPISKQLDKLRSAVFFRNGGYGTTFVISKK